MTGNETSFVEEIAINLGVNTKSIICSYLEKKTMAANRSSKARRALGNLYALYVLAQDYVDGNQQGSTFSNLMSRMKSLPFGASLQNHPLDNRLNDEMNGKYELSVEMLPVQRVNTDDKERLRKISVQLLKEGGNKPYDAAVFIVETIERYIEIITDNQMAYLTEIEDANDEEMIVILVESAFRYEADARLFEIITYALLFLYFREKTISIIIDGQEQQHKLSLYRTGRTNANDGGIDFVLKPLGRFFQVTETLDFKKYFLDFDKTNRFPISFVIKTELAPPEALAKIKTEAQKLMEENDVNRYMALFEEVITLPTLRRMLDSIKTSNERILELKEIIISSFKLEYGLLN